MSVGDAPAVEQPVCGLYGEQYWLGDTGSVHVFCQL